MSGWVAGLDGVRGGWIAALVRADLGEVRLVRLGRFAEALVLEPAPAVVAIDIPIGLAERAVPGARACETAARRALGPRASSVFPAPPRALVHAIAGGLGYAQACAMARALGAARGLSRQAYAIAPKIAEVDAALVGAVQERVVEVHPELAFAAMAGGVPCAYAKKVPQGHAERYRRLEEAGFRDPAALVAARPLGVGRDDAVDALAAAWTASRVLRGEARFLPPRRAPQRDARGLRCEIAA